MKYLLIIFLVAAGTVGFVMGSVNLLTRVIEAPYSCYFLAGRYTDDPYVRRLMADKFLSQHDCDLFLSELERRDRPDEERMKQSVIDSFARSGE